MAGVCDVIQADAHWCPAPISLTPDASVVALGLLHIQARVKKKFRPGLSLPLVMIFCLLNVLPLEKLGDSGLLPLKSNCSVTEPQVWLAGCCYQATPGIIGICFPEIPVRRKWVQPFLPRDVKSCSHMVFCLEKTKNNIRAWAFTRPCCPLLTSCLQMLGYSC